MEEQKIIAVVGATGAQGGGLARAILSDPAGGFTVRAITRHPDSDHAQALAGRGADVVTADLDDPASLRRAFDGAYGAYCVTNFWEHFSADREIAQAAALAEAARETGLAHTIWSTFEDTRRWVPLDDDRMPTLQGRFKVPHYDAKGEADALFTGPTTWLRTSFYWENFINLGMHPQPGPDGELRLTLPLDGARLPGIAAEDIGRCAYGIFQQALVDQVIGVSGGNLTGGELAAEFTGALGRPVRYQPVSPDEYRKLGFPGADDLGNMFQFVRDANEEYCEVRDVTRTRSLNPRLLTFAAWLDTHLEQLPTG
ncbi:NmrA/HSCARG family protein [Natronosporangium hydrolyticum]|uniref:NmrA/HSCARG family protein n=1 Tax=Natronosporangium hydrolyticum TaxID=2811111 RepID=A0A895YKT3_9ACTN|nr:NmrA/HSCARG family protein [Natronosporangium hydrolyticum]QSB15266.1 NmrA/HSCARG family protein [Natronosporangium hydrolyticum]